MSGESRRRGHMNIGGSFTIKLVDGGYIITTDTGLQRVVMSYRKLIQLIAEAFGPSKHPSDEDMSGQIEQPNQ